MLNDLFIQSCSVQTWEKMTAFKLPPPSYAIATVHGRCERKFGKETMFYEAEITGYPPWCLPAIPQTALERKTLPLIRFRLLASQIRVQDPPFPSLQVGDSSRSLPFESSQWLSHLNCSRHCFPDTVLQSPPELTCRSFLALQAAEFSRTLGLLLHDGVMR